MKKVLLDTSFILSAVRNGIDLFEEMVGYQILIPEQVIGEINRISKSRKKLRFREEAKLAERILEKSRFQKVNLGKGHTDRLISRFAKENPSILIATLDRELKRKIKNSKMVILKKKRLGEV